MRNSIQQILVNALEEIMDCYEESGLSELYVMSKRFEEIGDNMMKDIMGVFIENADKALCEDAKSERKADGFTIKERDVARQIHTFLGDFLFQRTYFKDEDGGYSHILDQILGINAYERVDAGVAAEMVNTATSVSYGKSADIITGGAISRQTAWSRMQDVGEVAFVPLRKDNTPKTLHIFADEDHVSLQDGKNTIVPLVTYCSGKKNICKGRNALIDPVHSCGYGLKAEKHWEYVYAMASEQYDMSKVEKVFIYGDGAKWIKSGQDAFAGAVYVFDEYHLEKRLKTLLSGEICKAFASHIRASLKNDDAKTFQKLIYKMMDAVESRMDAGKPRKKKLEALHDNSVFLLNHWQEIQNGSLPGTIGSCTEALVSHVLSKRLSRDPMGWSKEGLRKLAMARVFCLNGGIIMPDDIGSGKAEDEDRKNTRDIRKYEAIILKQHNKIFKGRSGWKWFEPEQSKISCKTSGTKVALDALGKMRDVC